MKKCDIGMIGLGVMGKNLVLNMMDKGFLVAGYDPSPHQVEALIHESGKNILATTDIEAFIHSLAEPRAIMLLIPAGPPVNSVIEQLLPYLKEDDLVIDGGNSYFKDTDLRIRYLEPKKIHWMGLGISGGEEGARQGPSLMPGGSKVAYERVSHLFNSISAKVDNEPCAAYIGPGASGHFVKMVHNGIEYGIMQLIAETYTVMKYGLKLNEADIGNIYRQWNKGYLKSYLIEITACIFDKVDTLTNDRLINKILAVARQNGTGVWTSRSAMELKVATPTIDMAVIMRDMSTLQHQREQAQTIYAQEGKFEGVDLKAVINDLEAALYSGIVITYAQGMNLLKVASDFYHFELDLSVIIRLWRAGCIIRADLLKDLSQAFKTNSALSNLLLDKDIAQTLKERQKGLRQIISQAAKEGVAVPGLMACLSYFDTYKTLDSPANLIQAQRDFFGAHLYERNDIKGQFHTQW